MVQRRTKKWDFYAFTNLGWCSQLHTTRIFFSSRLDSILAKCRKVLGAHRFNARLPADYRLAAAARATGTVATTDSQSQHQAADIAHTDHPHHLPGMLCEPGIC